MSEDRERYIVKEILIKKRVELLFLSKWLKDLVRDLDKLKEYEKQFIVNKAEGELPIQLHGLYGLLNEYIY